MGRGRPKSCREGFVVVPIKRHDACRHKKARQAPRRRIRAATAGRRRTRAAVASGSTRQSRRVRGLPAQAAARPAATKRKRTRSRARAVAPTRSSRRQRGLPAAQ